MARRGRDESERATPSLFGLSSASQRLLGPRVRGESSESLAGRSRLSVGHKQCAVASVEPSYRFPAQPETFFWAAYQCQRARWQSSQAAQGRRRDNGLLFGRNNSLAATFARQAS